MARKDWQAACDLLSRAAQETRASGRSVDETLLKLTHKAQLYRADELLSMGDVDGAERLTLATASVGSATTNVRLARIALRRGDFGRAISEWRSILESLRLSRQEVKASVAKEMAAVYLSFAGARMRLGDRAAARDLCDELLRALPQFEPDVRALLQSRPPEAADDASEGEPPPAPSFDEQRGGVQRLMREGRFSEADAMLTDALSAYPRNKELRHARAAFPDARASGRPVVGAAFQGGFARDRRIATWSEPRPADGRTSVLLAGDTAHRSNWGCRATTAGLRALIESCDARIDYTMDMIQWPAYLGESADARIADGTPDDLERFAEMLAARPDAPAAQALRRCDVVVLNGEGAFLNFTAAGRRLLALAFAARTVFDKPCILVNQTADLRDPRFLALAERVYPLLDDVLFRERISLRESGAIRDVRGLPQGFAADAIHILKPGSEQAWRETARRPGAFAAYPDVVLPLDLMVPYIVLGGSARFRFQPRGDHDSLADYVGLARALSRRMPVVIVAIEHQEEAYLRAAAEETGCGFVGPGLSVPQAVDLVGHAALYVGGRWHTALKALMGGGPVVMLETNSRYKTRGLLDLFGLDQPEIDFYEAGSALPAILDEVDAALGRGEAERRRIRDISDRMATSARDNVRFLAGRSVS